MDIIIPEEYKKECVYLYSRYGKFIQRYNIHTAVKKSKLNSLIDDTKISFPAMKKYNFLKDYLLNDDYTIEDFIGIRDPSLRGFIYEAIWDICIKCNIISELRQPDYHHVKGKIESLRYIDKQIEAIDDIYSYLTNTNVQSGNIGGVSDITLQKKDHYVLISSKFYTYEKEIDKYDIESLYHAIAPTKKTFDIILLVNDKDNVRSRIKKTAKIHLIDNIHYIYDNLDISIYLLQLRKLLSISQYIWGENGIKKIINSPTRKSIFIPSLHVDKIKYTIESWLLQNKAIEKIIISEMTFLLYDIALSLIDNKIGRRINIVCDKYHKEAIEKQMDLYLRIPSTVTFLNDKTTICDMTLYITDNKKKLQDILHDKHYRATSSIILYNTIDYDKSGPYILRYHYNDFKAWKDIWQEDKYAFSDFALEKAIRGYYGINAYKSDKYILRKEVYRHIKNTYSSYPDVYGIHISKTKLLEELFGLKTKYQDPNVIYNKLHKKHLFHGKLLWIVDPEMKEQIQKEIAANSFYMDRIKHGKIEMKYNYELQYTTTFLPNIIICLMDITLESIHRYIEKIFITFHQENRKQLSWLKYTPHTMNHIVWIDIHKPNINSFNLL